MEVSTQGEITNKSQVRGFEVIAPTGTSCRNMLFGSIRSRALMKIACEINGVSYADRLVFRDFVDKVVIESKSTNGFSFYGGTSPQESAQ